MKSVAKICGVAVLALGMFAAAAPEVSARNGRRAGSGVCQCLDSKGNVVISPRADQTYPACHNLCRNNTGPDGKPLTIRFLPNAE